jgi:hypothetical protein
VKLLSIEQIQHQRSLYIARACQASARGHEDKGILIVEWQQNAMLVEDRACRARVGASPGDQLVTSYSARKVGGRMRSRMIFMWTEDYLKLGKALLSLADAGSIRPQL